MAIVQSDILMDMGMHDLKLVAVSDDKAIVTYRCNDCKMLGTKRRGKYPYLSIRRREHDDRVTGCIDSKYYNKKIRR